MKTIFKIFILLVFAQNLFAQKVTEKKNITKQQILFVCEHGAARSTIASAYFNKIADSLKLNYKSIFRGTVPDSTVTKGTQAGLIKDNFKIENWKPEIVTENDIKNSIKVITFDCNIPDLNVTEKWDGIPAISKDYIVARNAILDKVNELIKKLKEEEKLIRESKKRKK